MKKVLFSSLIASTLMGCAMDEGSKGRAAVESMTSTIGKSMPAPSLNFKPLDILPYPTKQVYKEVINILDESRISVLNENKEDGRISTDYIAGPVFVTAGGLLGSNSTRYKYLISIRDISGSTKLKVTAFVESSGNKIQSWRDVSEQNQTQVRSIENALIEKIEKSLKR